MVHIRILTEDGRVLQDSKQPNYGTTSTSKTNEEEYPMGRVGVHIRRGKDHDKITEDVGRPRGIPDGEKWMRWKRKRSKTFASFFLVGLIIGIDYTVVFSTLYLYLRDTMKISNGDVLYGIIISAYQISSTVFGVLTGRWLDRSRSFKLYTNILLLIQILGGILYLIPYHFAFPLAGRFLAGTGDSFVSVCMGEVVRTYSEEESTRAIWWLASCFSVGSVMGPVIPLAFHGIRFKVGPLEVNQYNFVGLFMAALFFIAIFFVNFLMHDCSKEFDLKALSQVSSNRTSLTGNRTSSAGSWTSSTHSASTSVDGTIREGRYVDLNEEEPLVNTSHTDLASTSSLREQCESPTSPPPPLSLTLKKLATNFDVSLIFASTLICMYSMFSVDVLIPLLFVELLKWKFVALVIFLVSSDVVYGCVLVTLSRVCTTNRSLFYTMVMCLFCTMLMYLTIAGIKFKERDDEVDYVLVTFLGLFWVLTTCTEEVLLRAILARKVPSSVQSFTETIRNGIASTAAIVGAVSTPLVLSVIHWWACAMIGVVFSLFVCFLLRRRSLVSGEEISFDITVEC